MIIHVSVSTSLGMAPNRKMLSTSVLEGLRLGADAISVHVNIGSKEEPEMLEQLGMVADQCDDYQVPFIAMMYPAGREHQGPRRPCRRGARGEGRRRGRGGHRQDCLHGRPSRAFREVVRKCPVPVVLAGGVKVDTDEKVLKLAHDVMEAGAIGVTFGRNVFQHPDPTSITRALRRIVIDKAQRRRGDGGHDRCQRLRKK